MGIGVEEDRDETGRKRGKWGQAKISQTGSRKEPLCFGILSVTCDKVQKTMQRFQYHGTEKHSSKASI